MVGGKVPEGRWCSVSWDDSEANVGPRKEKAERRRGPRSLDGFSSSPLHPFPTVLCGQDLEARPEGGVCGGGQGQGQVVKLVEEVQR